MRLRYNPAKCLRLSTRKKKNGRVLKKTPHVSDNAETGNILQLRQTFLYYAVFGSLRLKLPATGNYKLPLGHQSGYLTNYISALL
ncbi:hypothetical protein C725_3039 [Pacificimonas flava]|uniref:Uncharacterized protein n=1 Tax=Pacificimonas flava TaxID=1234595 RepID=M2U186_9SPHN|nr:hypothetical protein C725_3039 [Pacificimonas flava]